MSQRSGPTETLDATSDPGPPQRDKKPRKQGPLFVPYVNKKDNGRENGLPKGTIMADPTFVLRHTQSTQSTVHTEKERGAAQGSYAGPPPES